MLFKKSWLILIIFLATATHAFANVPYVPIQFPRDDAGHLSNVPYPVKNMSEWWYYSGKITTGNNRHFGYYLIIFNITKYMFGKKITLPIFTLQLTDIDKNKVYSSLIYYPKSETAFSTQQLDITLGKNKEVTLKNNAGIYTLNSDTATEQGPTVKLSFLMKPTRKPMFIGKNGLISMGNDTNSYYYSFTRMTTTGSLQIGNETFKINPAKSSSWMDHQWGDFILSAENTWFWTSIRLANNIDINLTNSLDSSTKAPGSIKTANIMMPNGKVLLTTDFQVTQTVHDSHAYPLVYDIEIKPIHLRLRLTSLANNQDGNQLWEGISKVEGTYQGKPVRGFAYVENTAHYGRPLPLLMNKITSSLAVLWQILRSS